MASVNQIMLFYSALIAVASFLGAYLYKAKPIIGLYAGALVGTLASAGLWSKYGSQMAGGGGY